MCLSNALNRNECTLMVSKSFVISNHKVPFKWTEELYRLPVTKYVSEINILRISGLLTLLHFYLAYLEKSLRGCLFLLDFVFIK